MHANSNSEAAKTQSIMWTLSRRILMVIALTLAFFLSAVMTIYIMFRSGDTRVPDVIGKTEVEAKGVLETGKFEVKIQRRNDDAPMNTVIETRPSPNSSVKTNSVITLVVSSGPAQNKSQFYPSEAPPPGGWAEAPPPGGWADTPRFDNQTAARLSDNVASSRQSAILPTYRPTYRAGGL